MKANKCLFKAKLCLFLFCNLLLISGLSYSQMTTWGLFGGGKVSFPTATTAPVIAPNGIPAPEINNVRAWPQNWRGFNAAYDDTGTLMFYVIAGYGFDQVYKKGLGGIFDANGNLLGAIRGCGRTVAIIPYPKRCGRYLVLTHDEQLSDDHVTYSGGYIWGTEVVTTPTTVGIGTFSSHPFFNVPILNPGNASKRQQCNFALSPFVVSDVSGLSGPQLKIEIAVSGPSSNNLSLSIYRETIQFELRGLLWECVLVPGGVDLSLTVPIGININPPGYSFDIGDIRISDDNMLLVSGSSQGLVGEFSPFNASSVGNFDFTTTGAVLGVEVTIAAGGRYRIFSSEIAAGQCRIFEREFDPSTMTLSPPVLIHTQNSPTILNRDQFGRLHWSSNGRFYQYRPAASIGSGTLSYNTSASPLSNTHPSVQTVTPFREFYHVPYVRQGADTILSFGLSSNCCERQNWHWKDQSAISLNLAQQVSNKTITIEGTFTVDRDLKFQNCEIYMRPNSKIEVKPGKHFEVRTTKIQACKDMWDGIYLTDPTARITVWNPPVPGPSSGFIKHAINGIVVKNGADFTLTNANMQDNYRHLQILNANRTYPNSITGSRFGCQQAGIGRIPHTNDITVRAIHAVNVTAIDLGQNQNLPPGALRNQISNAQVGIHIDNSSANINNWIMSDLAYAGIIAIRATAPRSVKTNFVNQLQRMQFGIMVLGYNGAYNCQLQENQMLDIKNTGIYVYACNKSNVIDIVGNRITNAKNAGIWVNHSYTSNIDIASNLINTSVGTTWSNTGIYMSEPIAAPAFGLPQGHIRNNVIDNIFAGVFMANISQPTVEENRIKINNALHPSGRGSGISANSSPGANINRNNINSFNGSFMVDKLGVFIDFGLKTIIDLNRIENIHSAIWLRGNCTNAALTCNEMHNYILGITYDDAIVGPQGTPNNAQRNTWYPGSIAPYAETYAIAVDASVWNFYAHQLTMPVWPMRNLRDFNTPAVAFTVVSGSMGVACGNIPFLDLHPITQGTQGFLNWSDIKQLSNKVWAQRSLLASPTLAASSNDYLQFRDTIALTTSGDLARFEQSMQSDDRVLASSIYAYLACSSPSEECYAAILKSYFRSFYSGVALTNADSIVVDSHATRNASEGNSSIWLSRWLKMTNQVEPLFNWVETSVVLPGPSSKNEEISSENSVPSRSKVYPVPASDEFTFVWEGERSVQFSLLGLDGKVLRSGFVMPGANLLKCDGLSQGIYYLSINNSNHRFKVILF